MWILNAPFADVFVVRAKSDAHDRKQFNRPIAQTQLFQKKLADMETEISIGLQAALRVSQLLDEGRAAL